MTRRRGPAEDVGQTLARLRMARGHSIQQLSRLSGLRPSTIGGLERGDLEPSDDCVLALSAALGAPPEYFSRGGDVARGRAIPVAEVEIDGETTYGSTGEPAGRGGDGRTAATLTVYKAGSSSRSLRARGERWGIVLRGRLKISIGEDVHFLQGGDSVRCPRCLPCLAENLEADPAECIWIDAEAESTDSR